MFTEELQLFPFFHFCTKILTLRHIHFKIEQVLRQIHFKIEQVARFI